MNIKNNFSKEKLLLHTDRINDWKNGVDIYPIVMEVNIINACNYDCVWCSEGGYRKENIKDKVNTEDMLSAIEDMSVGGVKSIVWEGGGEPTLHPSFMEFVKTSWAVNIKNGLITNGSRLKDKYEVVEYCKFIRFSFDSGSKEIYESQHKTPKDSYELVIENMRGLVKHRIETESNCVLGISFIITDITSVDIEKATALWKEVGVDYIQFKPEILTTDESIHLVEGVEKTLRYVKSFYSDDNFEVFVSRYDGAGGDDVCVKEKNYDKCFAHRFVGAMTANGSIQLCCNLKHQNGDKFSYGNISEQSFKSIWTGKKRQSLVKTVENTPSDSKPFTKTECGQCRFDAMNHQLISIDEKNLNDLGDFI